MLRTLITSAIAIAAIGLGTAGLAAADENTADHERCLGGCPCDCQPKVCRPTIDKKDVTKRVYGEACEFFCLPKTSLFGHRKCGCGGGCGQCDSCADNCDTCGDNCGDCATCGKVRMKKVLILKVRHHDECVHKCVVENAPCACAADSCDR